MKFILIISNIASLLIGSLITFLLIFYYISDDFQKTYIDVLKFIIMPLIALSIGFYQWKKVLLHKNFAEKQFETIVKLLDLLKKTSFMVCTESSNGKSMSIFKFDRNNSSLYEKNDLDKKIFLKGIKNNSYLNAIEKLEPILNDVFLPLSVAKAFNKLQYGAFSKVEKKDIPEEYAYINDYSNEDDEEYFIPHGTSHSALTLGNLIEAKDDIFHQIENWLEENSINQKLNTEYNRYDVK
ncbi:hypothetical protein [Aliarcobacter cryaerophilus]|uniref:hypothetical protein n=1 Tax=Aliarcobacter cryaerophilus TaxID=28198 RepID=UPI0013DE5AC6|nr:hypothetical protein [Aliarcobacter cryaerophilus]